MPAIMVGTAMMAAHPASRFMSSFWETAISDRLASSAVVSSSRSVSTRSLIRITWSYTSRKYARSEEHTSELQSRPHLVCRLLLEKKKKKKIGNKEKRIDKQTLI